MLGMDGLQLLEALRAHGLSSPVVLTSTAAEVPDVLAAWHGGAADFLPKPFSRIQLRDALRRAESVPVTPRTAPVSESDPAAPPPPAARPTPIETPVERMWRELTTFLRDGDLALPVTPRVLQRVSALSAETSPDPKAIFDLLDADAQLGRAVLRVAGTAEFRGLEPPGSVREGAARLGALRALASAATAAHRANYTFNGSALSALASKLWLGHFMTALTAETLAVELGHPRPDQMQTLSLFADVGELIILRAAVHLWPYEIAGGEPSDRLRRLAVERRRAVSAISLTEWGMPARFVAVARHSSDDSLASVGAEDRDTIALLQMARRLASGAVGGGPFGADPALAEPPADGLPALEPARAAEVTRSALGRVRALLYA